MSIDELSLSGLLVSIARECLDSLKRNRLAAGLAVIALVTTTVLAFSSQYDERARYRAVLLPDIAASEARFQEEMRDAETTRNETWRLYYFIDAHRKVRGILDLLNRRWPHTREGRRAHADLIRYYDLLSEDFAIVRTQASLDEQLDFLALWKKSEAERRPLRERWQKWVNSSGL